MDSDRKVVSIGTESAAQVAGKYFWDLLKRRILLIPKVHEKEHDAQKGY